MFAKLRAASSFAGPSRVSFPGDVPTVTANRSASAPYLSMASSGSTTFPRVLLIFAPSTSRIRPLRYTVWKGAFPVFSSPIMIIRATQKNRMSCPVSITLVG